MEPNQPPPRPPIFSSPPPGAVVPPTMADPEAAGEPDESEDGPRSRRWALPVVGGVAILALVVGVVVQWRTIGDRDDTITTLETDLTDTRGDLDATSDDLDGARSDIEGLEGDVDRKDQELSDIESACEEFADAVLAYDDLNSQLSLQLYAALEVVGNAVVYPTQADVIRLEQILADVERIVGERNVAGTDAARLGTDCTGVPMTFGDDVAPPAGEPPTA